METAVFFVRHAESVYVPGKERARGLTEKGQSDALRIKDLLMNEDIEAYISSPFERALATIRPAAAASSKAIIVEENLKERAMGRFHPLPFDEAKRNLYEDFTLAFPDGEASVQAQQRAIRILKRIMDLYLGKKIAIGTHGDIMTLMINAYDSSYGYDFWARTSMPDLYRLVFDHQKLQSVTRLWRT